MKLIIIGLILLLLIFGCTQSNNNNLQEQLDGNITLLNQANTKIITLQENAKYTDGQSNKIQKEKEELQLVYNDLFGDAASCYWANACLKREQSCLISLGDNFPGRTAQQIHEFYSDECDRMLINWDEYYAHDSSVE